MEYLKIILRTSFFYFFIVFIYRIMGKREVGQLGIIDLIVSILIAELVVISIEDTSVSMFNSIVPILCIVFFEIVLSYGSLKNTKIRGMLDGKPTFMINHGKVNYNEMIRQKYNLDDLLTQLREKGYRNIEDVEYAILENNGTLSVFEYDEKHDKSPLPMPLILDGRIQFDTLKVMNKDISFINGILKNKKVSLDDIFYAFYKDKNIFIIKYNEIE